MANIFERLRREAEQKALQARQRSGNPTGYLAALISQAQQGDQQIAVPPLFIQSLTSEDVSAAAARGLMGTEFELAQQARRRRALVDLIRALRQQEIARRFQQQQLGLQAAGALMEYNLARQNMKEQRRRSWLETIGQVATTAGQILAAVLL